MVVEHPDYTAQAAVARQCIIGVFIPREFHKLAFRISETDTVIAPKETFKLNNASQHTHLHDRVP